MPSVWDETAWKQPATEDEVIEAVGYLTTCVDVVAGHRVDEKYKATIIRLVGGRGYTRAELLLAMHHLPFDPRAAFNFGKGFNPADVERIVEEHRALRRRLKAPVTLAERDRLLAACPELAAADFHCCGFDADNQPLFRYVPGLGQKLEVRSVKGETGLVAGCHGRNDT